MAKTLFQVLKKQHQGLKEILSQLDETTEKAPKKREQLFQKLKTELVPHMKAEDSSFYAPLLAKKDARGTALEAIEEHHVAELILEELNKMSKDDERWGAKMAVFKEIVEHHMKEEESRVFKKTKETMSAEEIQTIGARYDGEEQKLKQSFK